MTKKLYYDDAMIQTFESKVVECTAQNGKYSVVLDATCFFPTMGGQNADTGKIDNANVLDVTEQNGIITHITDTPLEVGKTVTGQIDFDIRFRKMQSHTGEHIVSGTVHNIFGFENKGFHLGDGPYFTCDFTGELSKEDVVTLENEVNKIIAENRRVEAIVYKTAGDIPFDYRAKNEFENNIRIVSIENCDRCACCAPHLSCTGQVGVAKIISAVKYKGGTRVTAVCGLNAFDDYRMIFNENEGISRLLSAKREETGSAVARLIEERDELKQKLNAIKTQMAQSIADKAKQKGENIVFLPADSDNDMLLSAMNAFETGCAVLFGEGDEYSFAAKGEEDKMQQLCKAVKQELNGKGGGKGTLVRGKVCGSKDVIANLLGRYL